MRCLTKALALLLAVSLAARAEDAPGTKGTATHVVRSEGGHHHGHDGVDTGLVFLDLFLDMAMLGAEAAAYQDAVAHAPPPPDGYAQRTADDPPGRPWRVVRRRMQARQGLLLSFGLGGGSMNLSLPDTGRTGAFDLDFRLGYGFSDRFQLFMDLGMDAASYNYGMYAGTDLASWTFTLRGQTVLIGDRAGNGLNLNFGAGLGGVSFNNGYYDQWSTETGLALAGGISYDARVSPWFALSPEFFYTWHAIPNAPGLPQDTARVYGLRINFLWYLQ